MTRTRIVVTMLIVAVALAAVVGGWLYLVFVRGSTTSLQLGGSWELEVRSTMSHGSGSARLYRRKGWHRVLVDDLVLSNQYYGDDCVAYATARGTADRSYYAACADREPVLLGQRRFGQTNGQSHLTEWRIDPDGVVQIESTRSQRAEQKLSVAEIKRRALAQLPRRDDWSTK